MKWLTLEQIKAQLRIEPGFTAEDTLLTGYGNSAESTILNHLNRKYYDLIDQYGDASADNAAWDDIINASKMLVDVWYQHRSPVESLNMSVVPYTFDLLIKPYMRLASAEDAGEMTSVVKGDDTKIEFTADLPDGLKLSDVDFTGIIINADTAKTVAFAKADCIMVDDGESYVVLVDTNEMGIGQLLLKVTVQIPDTDYPNGYRKAIIKINPHTQITG